jgi:tetratricopeptide (TPR) repeat protein
MKLRTTIALATSSLLLTACATAPLAGSNGPIAPNGGGQLYASTLAGRYADLIGQPADAARYYAKAHASKPLDAEIFSRAVDASLAAGDVQAAAKLTLSVPNDMRTTPGVLALAVNALAEKRSRAALEATSSRTFGPLGGWLARSLEAWVLADQGKADLAVEKIAAPTGLSILDRIADFQRGALLERIGRLDDAETAYAEGWTRGGRFAQGVEAYGRLLESRGKQAEAIKIYDAFLSDVGDNPWIEAARARAQSGTLAALAPRSAGEGAAIAFFGGAAAIGSQADIEAAIPWLFLTLTLDPTHDPARMMLASALSQVSREGEAIALWKAVPRSSPYYSAAQAEQAWALRRAGKDNEALALAQAALADTGSERSRAALADLYRASSQYEEAEALYSRILNDTPDDARGWRLYFSRGAMRERLKRYDDADSDFNAALKLAPDEPEVLNYQAYSWVERGIRTDQALAMLQIAVAKQPKAGFIVDSLGWALFKLGRYPEAVQRLEEAAGLAAGDPEINDHLGDAYWRVGRAAEAKFQWERVLSLEPEPELMKRIQDKLLNGLPEKAATHAANK